MINRILVSKIELESLIRAKLAQHKECLGMPFMGIYELSKVDETGCNWRELGFNIDNTSPESRNKAIMVINEMRQNYNLK